MSNPLKVYDVIHSENITVDGCDAVISIEVITEQFKAKNIMPVRISTEITGGYGFARWYNTVEEATSAFQENIEYAMSMKVRRKASPSDIYDIGCDYEDCNDTYFDMSEEDRDYLGDIDEEVMPDYFDDPLII